jgi:hypothetical protein
LTESKIGAGKKEGKESGGDEEQTTPQQPNTTSVSPIAPRFTDYYHFATKSEQVNAVESDLEQVKPEVFTAAEKENDVNAIADGSEL